MKGMYKDVSVNGKRYCMKHLAPFKFLAAISGIEAPVQVSVTFGTHVFTDQKENGPELFPGRYFCVDRYTASIGLPALLSDHLLLSHVVPHVNKANNENYFYSTVNNYVVFFDLRKDDSHENGLRLIVISAYEVDTWGKSSLPRGTPVKFSFITHLRLAGKTYLASKKNDRKAKRR